MMRIVVAEEGRELEPDAEFQEIYQQGNLSLALQSLTGVAAASQLIYLHSGEQLREDNTEELLVTPDLTLYIFNSDLVGAGNHPPAELLVAPDETLPLSGNLIHDAETHLAQIRSLGASVGIHHESLSVIVRNIESHLAVLADTFDSFRNVAQLELDRQQSLLQGHKLDLEIIAKVKVHPEFLSATVRRQVEATGRERTLGDYVSTSKMQMVAESCARLHDDLSTRYSSAVDSFDRLVASVAELKVRLDSSFSSNVASFISQAEGVMSDLRSGQSAFGILVQHANDSALTPMNATVLANQSRLVQIYREACIVKNDSTAHVFAFLSDVSDIHRLMSGIPEVLASLESDFRQKGGFPHLQRLHSMLHMYGATVIEVVRRREFSRFFLEKAQAIAEVLAKLSSHERKRRQVYRSEVHGQLPFDPRGMDEPAPTLEISTSGGEELAIAIERQDIATFLDLVSQIERTSNMMDLPQGFVHPAAEASVAFERLVARLDSLESDFDRLAERAVLSASRIYQSRRQSTTDQSSIQSLVDQLREARAAKTEQEISFQRETAHLKDEIERLRAEAGTVSGTRQRLERLEIELDVTRTKHANEVAVRQGLEKRVKDVERARNEAERRAESEAVQFDASKLATLEAEKAEFASSLNRLQVHNGRLEEELERLRGEKDSLSQAVREKDGMLKEQATTAERSLRDHIAETDGDRAVLEQQVAELRRALEYQNSIEVQKLQQQLSRLEQENRLLETKLAASNGTALKLATVARELYDGQVQALSAAQSVLKASKANPIATDAESPTMIVPTIELPAPLPEFDSTNPEAMIAALTGVSPKLLGEVVVKIGSNARKYLKLSKEYRDRSKSKIAFRNFSRGDLALFLPTRNSIAKPWAAFNVAFPHYFLNATEDISELLKSREWIVARILSITERIADSKQPDGNPFGLGDGVKFHLLDVEDWTQPSNVAKKRTNSNPTRPISIASYEARERISSWSETTALATALPHSLSDREGEVVRLGARAPSPPGPPSRYFSKLSVSPSAGPSSLSKVLAQAPTPSSPRPSSTISNTRNHERSRSRTTSLSSVRRPQLGVGGSNKAAATIALSDPIAPATPSTATAAATPEDADVPSPSGSAFDGMGSVVLSRRRPSLSPGMSAGSTLANIASNWGLPLGRKRAQEQARASPVPSEIE